MPKEHRVAELQVFNERDDITGEILVTIPAQRRARLSVTSGIGHDNVIVILESARQRTPTAATRGEPVKQNQWRLIPSRSQVLKVDVVYVAAASNPAHTMP